MGKILKFLSGAMMGGLVGVTLGILLAPASGDELRNKMRDRAENIRDEIRLAAENRRVELERHLSELRAPANTEIEI